MHPRRLQATHASSCRGTACSMSMPGDLTHKTCKLCCKFSCNWQYVSPCNTNANHIATMLQSHSADNHCQGFNIINTRCIELCEQKLYFVFVSSISPTRLLSTVYMAVRNVGKKEEVWGGGRGRGQGGSPGGLGGGGRVAHPAARRGVGFSQRVGC